MKNKYFFYYCLLKNFKSKYNKSNIIYIKKGKIN